MFNPISYTYLYIKKNINRKFLQIIGHLFIFLCCLFILIKWNTIPHIKDEIEFLEPTPYCKEIQEKGVVEISVKSPYLSYAYKDSIGGKVELNCILSHEYKTPIKSIYGRIKDLKDEIIDLDDIENIQTSIDSMPTFGLYILRYRKNVIFLNRCFNRKDKRKTKTEFLHEKNVFAFVKDHFHSLPGDSEGILISGSNGRGFYSFGSQVTPSYNFAFMFARLTTLNDISQANYSLTIGNLPINSDSILLNIDFGGATRFAGISPTPDEYTYSGIRYTDQKKIKQIMNGKVQLYCQFLETSNIQSTRVYILSTIATFFFGLFAKRLIESIPSLLRHIRRNWSKYNQLRAYMRRKSFKTISKLIRWYSYQWGASLWLTFIGLYASAKHIIECGFMGCLPGIYAISFLLWSLPYSFNYFYALKIKRMWQKGEKGEAVSALKKCTSFHRRPFIIKYYIVIVLTLIAMNILKEVVCR